MWSANKISTMKAPFFATLFTVSSHPPYSIPEKYKDRFKGGPTEMHDAIAYADFALSRFFESAKKTPWYNNTLFVIVADHTPATYEPLYYKEMGNLHIPLVFFHPNDSTFRGRSEKVTSQADVMPGILHLAGYHEPFAAFGKSMFDTLSGYSACQIGNKFLYFGTVDQQHYMIIFEGEKTTAIYNLNDRYQGENLLGKPGLGALEERLKAMIQTYNHALIQNKMTLN
jgi:phosphoglycerol transferase MdoB-like AlkP superfamily enzyme